MASMHFNCVHCKKKTNRKVFLQPCEINNELMIFLCPSQKCLYPLTCRKLHKFVYKQISPESELQMCDPSEVPSARSILQILVNSSKRETPFKLEEFTSAMPDSKEMSPVLVVLSDSEPEEQDGLFEGGTNFQIKKKEFFWLYSTLCLLVHSTKLQHYFKYEEFGDSQLKIFTDAYSKAVSAVNSNKYFVKSFLTPSTPLSNIEKVHEIAFGFLLPDGYKTGQEESPVLAIVKLLRENRNLHKLFLSKFTLELKCDNCGCEETSQSKTSLYSIRGTVQIFEDTSVIYNTQCVQCRANGQMTLWFCDLSPFLLMHFVDGLPSNDLASLNFLHGGQMYFVSGFVQHNQSRQHFVPWIRSGEGKQWECCDELNPLLRNLTTQLPAIPSSEIHIVMWEQRETSCEIDLSWLGSNWKDPHEICISESTKPPVITLDDSDSEDHKTIFVDQESSAASQKLGVFATTDFKKNSSTSTLRPELLSPAISHSNNSTDEGSVPYCSLYGTSEWNTGKELFGCTMNASFTSEQKDSTFQRKKSKLSSSKEVCSSIDESQILCKVDTTENNYYCVADCIENLNVQKAKKQTHHTTSVPSSSESPPNAACNAQFQNTREKILQPSKNLRSKSILEDSLQSVAEMKVSNADEKSESMICDVTSNSKNKAGGGESKNWNSSVDFESATHDGEGCTDTETDANDKLSRGENINSLSQAVEGMSRSKHETHKINKRKVASHFQMMQHSEHSCDTTLFGNVSECYVTVDKLVVETYVKKHGLEKKDSDKEDSYSQSASSLPKTSVKAQSHNYSGKTTFLMGGNAVKKASSGKPNCSVGMVMSPPVHNIPFKKSLRKLKKIASDKSPSTEQTEASLVSSPVSGQDSYVEEPNREAITDTGKVCTRWMKKYESECNKTGGNALQIDSNIPVTSDTFTSSIIALDLPVTNSMKENSSVHPVAMLNNTSLTQLDSVVADFELKEGSLCKVISPVNSNPSFTAPSADDSASLGNRENAFDAGIQHTEDLKTQQLNNLSIPSVQDAKTEWKADCLWQMCKSTVSTITDHEENKDGTQLAASDPQKTLKNDDPSNTMLLGFLGDISASKDLYQVTDQNLDLSVNNTTSSDKDIKNSHTVTDEGRSFCSSELTFPKHSNLNIKKPCAKIIGQRKTLKNVTTIPEQLAINENKTSKFKNISLKSKPDKILEPAVLQGSCFQSKSRVGDSRHLPKAMRQKSVSDKGTEPNSVKFMKVPVGTQPSVPECCVKSGVLNVNGDGSCRNETSLNYNEVHLRVTETKSPKPSSGGTDIKSKDFAQSICNAKEQAESKSLKKTEVFHKAVENILTFQNIVAVFHRSTEDVVCENAQEVSEVLCPDGKSMYCPKKKLENENSTTQVCLSTGSAHLKKSSEPVKSAPQRVSERQTKSSCSNEVMTPEQSETYDIRTWVKRPENIEFYVAVKAIISGHNARPTVLNESQNSESASPQMELGVVKNHVESVSICASASQDSTIGQKSCGRKKKGVKDKVQNEDKSPSLDKNSDQPGTAKGITSEKNIRLSMKICESKKRSLSNEGINAEHSPFKTVSQPDTLEDQNGTTPGENRFEELSNILDDNSVFSQTGDSHPTEGKSAATKGSPVKVTKKSPASVLEAKKKRQSSKYLLPKPTVPIKRKSKKTGDAVVNSDQPGTAKGITSEKKMRLMMKTVCFKTGVSKKRSLSNEGINAEHCPSKTVSPPDILEDQNCTTSGENRFEELNNILDDNSVFSQTGDSHPAEGKSAATKGSSLKVAKKSPASVLEAKKKRQSSKYLSPRPTVPIKRKSKNTGDAVNMNVVQQVQPSKSNAETQSENQCAVSNSGIFSEEKKCIYPKTFPLLSSLPLQYSPEDLSMSFQFCNSVPHHQVSSIKWDEEF